MIVKRLLSSALSSALMFQCTLPGMAQGDAKSALQQQLAKARQAGDWQKEQILQKQFVLDEIEAHKPAEEWRDDCQKLFSSYCQHGQSKEAMTLAQKALNAAGDSFGCEFSYLAETAGDIDLAESLKKGEVAHPYIANKIQATYDLGNFYYRHKKFDLAEQAYRQAAAEVPGPSGDDPECTHINEVYRLALFLLVRGKTSESKQLFEKVLQTLEKHANDDNVDRPDDGCCGYLSILRTQDPKLFAQAEKRIPYAENIFGCWGMINKKGEVIIPAKYFSLSSFHDGFASAEIVGRWGLLDRNGKWAIWPSFGRLKALSNGLIAASSHFEPFYINYVPDDNFKYGFVDTSGKFQIQPKFQFAERFRDGLAAVQMDDGTWSYVNRQGKVLIDGADKTYEHLRTGPAKEFVTLWIRQGQQDKWFRELMDKHCLEPGKPKLTQPVRTAAPNEFLLPFSTEIGGFRKYGYQTLDGDVVIPAKFDCAMFYSEGLAAVGIRAGGEYRFGYIDLAGNSVIEPSYDKAYDFHDGLAIVSCDNPESQRSHGCSVSSPTGVSYFIDKTGVDPFSGKYADVKLFSEGLAAVSEDGHKFGVIDRNGKIIAAPEYPGIRPFRDGMAAVWTKEGFGFIDKTGKLVIEPKYPYALDFHEGFAAVHVFPGCRANHQTGPETVHHNGLSFTEFDEDLR